MSASNKKKLRKEQQSAALTEKQRKQQKEDKSLKAYTITFEVDMVHVIAIVLGIALKTPVEGAILRGSKAVSIGDRTLSTTELSYFYVDVINEYYSYYYSQLYSTYGSYWSIFLPFSTSTPLNEQEYDSTDGTTWADYFIDVAIDNAASTYALYDEAMAENYTLDEDTQATLDAMEENMEYYASYYGYSSTNAYLRAVYGSGATLKSYLKYYEIYATAMAFYSDYSDSLTYTEDDYRAYDADIYNEYSSYCFAYYTVTASSYLEGGTEVTDDDGNTTTEYSDEEYAAAREAAKADMETLLASGATDADSFDEAIQALEINADATASCTEYSYVQYANLTSYISNSSFNEEAQQWLSEDGRAVGDITSYTITTENDDGEEVVSSYYVLLYLGSNDNTDLMINVRHILVAFEEDDDGNVTDEAKEAALEEAQTLLASWKAGASTEDAFAELAEENSDDTGSSSNGGLYENVYYGEMVDAFNDWCFDENRKAGNTDIVETDYGYHIMYFVSQCELSYRDYMIDTQLRSDDLSAWHDGLVAQYEVTVLDLSHMAYDFTLS